MKKYIIILTILMVFILTGCSKSENPNVALNKIVASLSKSDYSNLYNVLSESSKKKVSKETFIKEYKDSYSALEVNSILVKASLPKKIKVDENGNIKVALQISINTIIGKRNFIYDATLRKEKVNKQTSYYLDWNESMILPELEEGDTIKVDAPSSLKAIRGKITDRNGVALATNGNSSTIGFEPRRITGDKNVTIAAAANLLGISADSINKLLSATWVKEDSFVPLQTLSISDTRISKLLALPGIEKRQNDSRVYPFSEVCAQLTGYVGTVTDTEYEKHKSEGYTKTDIIGKNGLEFTYEKRLRGVSGVSIYTVDAKGTKKKPIGDKAAINGEDIKLTIDIQLEKAAYAQLSNEAGNCAIINPLTGEVLALVSTPSYDPNLFVLGMSDSQWKALNSDPKKPLINRFANTYAPGSTFKFITAAIGLKTGKLTQGTVKNINGLNWQGNSSWGTYNVTRVDDTKGKDENLTDAFIYSDNIYFAQTALAITKDTFLEEAKKFGIGEKLNFPMSITTSQLVDKDGFKNDIQLADSGYGQGKVQISTLQLALIYSSLVNGGDIYNPLLETKDYTGAPKVSYPKVLSPDIIEAMKTDLLAVVDNPSGTGHSAQIPGMRIAGKTGTAEIKLSQDDKTGTENGWFAAVNIDNPKFLTVMMVEDVKAKGGSAFVASKVKDILKLYGNK
ncbi:MAG TPA: penicillin-binding transpeptidase domain-containing protein [Clostridiaceae bacterium]